MKSPELESQTEADHKVEEVEELISSILEHPEKVNLGCGNAACVWTAPGRTFCIKKEKDIIEEGHHPLNSIDKEMSYQSDVAALGVRTPVPIRAYVNSEGQSFLIMETIKGHSLAQIINENIPLPESYNHDEFWNELKQMLKKIHEQNLYHRDLHEGNVMVDFETGRPVLIDYGMSGYSFFENDDPYHKTNFFGPGNDLRLRNDDKEYDRMKREFDERIRSI